MASWELLDEKGESELHKTRLLNVEDKPFKRITKRLGSVSSAVLNVTQIDDSSRDGDESLVKANTSSLREDLTLDFAAFDHNITRLQFLHDANQRERERYGADQERIVAECHSVRANNAQLREQLEGARATLAQRKKFDELAEKITSNRLLRPREDQVVNLKKLDEECKELERERETYAETWNERREQFNRIMEEGMMLRRQIRDEKEEVDRREGMNEGGEDDVDAERGVQTPRNEPSGDGTPHPEGGDSQSKPDDDAGTPRPPASNGGATPSRDTPGQEGLRPLQNSMGSVSRSGSQMPSRDVSPAPPQTETEVEGKDDVDMEDEGEDKTGGETPLNGGDHMEVDN